MTPRAVTTLPFTLSQSAYTRTVMTLWLARWWWAWVTPIAVLTILGWAVDAAFWFVALMVIFMLIPSALSMVYYFHALAPRGVEAVNSQRTVTFRPDGSLSVRRADGAVRTVPRGAVRSVADHGHTLMVRMAGPDHYDFLCVPAEAFADPGDMDTVLSIFNPQETSL